MNSEQTVALVIHPDGEIVTVNLKPGVIHLALMYEHLDCRTVEVVRLTDKLDMWLDEEGLYCHPVNPVATALARRYGLTWQNYHGPVLVCGVNDDGDSIDLTSDQIVALATHLGDL